MPTENTVSRRRAEGESTVIAPQRLKTDHRSSENVSRRSVLRGVALGMAALAAGGDPLSAEPESRPPNIVFIVADDLGYADLACYGRPDLRTPNIDGLAAKGVRFLQAYANSAVCSATRTALITGRYQDKLSVGLDERELRIGLFTFAFSMSLPR